MAWNIAVLKNTLRMDDHVAEELVAAAEENYHLIGYSHEYGIEFDEDAMEHMDFLHESWADKILSHSSANGEVIFYSAEGDDRGTAWGYRYQRGRKTALDGELMFVEKEGADE